jgi:multidrug efflux pump subunit AcrA (membrane-fusion protein)
VAVVGPDHRVRLQSVTVGRDYGDQIEITSGLRDGDSIVASPSDVMHEGAEVDPYPVGSGSDAAH